MDRSSGPPAITRSHSFIDSLVQQASKYRLVVSTGLDPGAMTVNKNERGPSSQSFQATEGADIHPLIASISM